MAKKIKYGKIAIVIFLTALIWIWADLALDETLADRPATIIVDESVSPKLWVSFNQAPSADIKITLSGPHAAIANESRRLKESQIREFVLDVVQEKMDKPGDYDLRLLPFLQKDKQIRQLGLKVESCEPEVLDVNVVELVNKSLPVRCFDENEIPKDAESIEPATVNAFVPPEQTLVAKVRLSASEIEQARVSTIEKTPYIELPGGQTRDVATKVTIKMPEASDELTDYTITTATLGFSLSENLQGKYKVQLLNPTDMATVSIKATLAAKEAYRQQPFQMILYILDDDRMATGELRRTVVFNFPKEYISKDEIRQNQEPPTARFRLIPLTSSQSPIEGPPLRGNQ
ncbi:MAG: hypothetical protein ACE5NM_11985 [Sedimentisphaerales bacterium]